MVEKKSLQIFLVNIFPLYLIPAMCESNSRAKSSERIMYFYMHSYNLLVIKELFCFCFFLIHAQLFRRERDERFFVQFVKYGNYFIGWKTMF